MRRAAHGFTLLEVIGAIAVLSICFAVLLEAMGGSLALTRKAATRTQATAWARSKLDAAFVMRPPRPGVTTGRFDQRYRWRLRVQPWEPAHAGAPGSLHTLALYKLDLTVFWGQGRRTHAAHFETLRVANAPRRSGP